MQPDLALPIAIALFALALCAHWLLPQYTRRPRNTWAVRILLILLGIAVGMTFVRIDAIASAPPFSEFLLGFSLVHVPPAIVLLLKRWRRESPS